MFRTQMILEGIIYSSNITYPVKRGQPCMVCATKMVALARFKTPTTYDAEPAPKVGDKYPTPTIKT